MWQNANCLKEQKITKGQKVKDGKERKKGTWGRNLEIKALTLD